MFSFLSWFLSPGGLLLLAALDSSPVVFLPFANDAVVIYLAARSPGRFWLYPVVATIGGLVGTAVSHVVGVYIGEEGLKRWVPGKQLARVRRRAQKAGAVALGALAIVPPPFPFTPFVLASGAFEVSRPIFFGMVGTVRFARFFAEAWLARRYGGAIVGWMESAWVRDVVWGFVVLVVAGTAYSIHRLATRKA